MASSARSFSQVASGAEEPVRFSARQMADLVLIMTASYQIAKLTVTNPHFSAEATTLVAGPPTQQVSVPVAQEVTHMVVTMQRDL